MEPKLRDDLVVSEQEAGEGKLFVIKDPATDQFFRFKEVEQFIARGLDGVTPPSVIRQRAEKRFDVSLPEETVDAFVEQLRRLRLLEGTQTDSPPSSRGARIRGNPLYLRLKAFDPDRILDWLMPKVRLFFTSYFVLFSAALILSALGITLFNGGEIARDSQSLWRFDALLFAWLTVVLTTTAHEFAHGLTCKRFGGQVHEMGFMLIYFNPAFYCNVSDAWLFPERYKRLWVTFAGAYLDLVLWALATLTWRAVEPGTWLQFAALVVMATSGIKTFFNLNPLIKLDGYYLLSDFLEIPNLRAKATRYVGALLRGDRRARQKLSRRERRIFLVYGTLAGVYSFLILFFIARWAGGFLIGRFEGLGLIFFLILLALLFQNPLRKLKAKLFRRGAPEDETKKEVKPVKKRIKAGVALAALGAALYFGHWDLKISSPFQVTPRENADVRAEVEGLIEKVLVRQGDRVKAGDLLALLSPRDYVAEIEKVKKQIAEKEARLRLLRAGPRPEEIELARQEVDTARTALLFRRREYEEGRQVHHMRLVKAQVSVDKAQTRLEFGRKYFKLQEDVFREGLISRREFLEAQEALQVRQKELQEAQEEVRLVESEDLSALQSALALAEERLVEAERRLELLLAGSRKEEIEAVEAELARLRVELGHYETQKKLTRVVSPSAGIVTTPDLEEKVGEWLKKGDLILEVYDFRSVVARMAVPEKEIADVEVGQEVLLKARSFPGRTFRGRVTAIAPAIVQEEEEKAYQLQKVITVRSEIANPDFALRPGMSGTAKIVVGRRRIGQILARRVGRTFRVELWSWW